MFEIGRNYICKDGKLWTYVGSRVTSVGSLERVFVHLRDKGYWPNCLYIYKASKTETLKRKFPDWK